MRMALLAQQEREQVSEPVITVQEVVIPEQTQIQVPLLATPDETLPPPEQPQVPEVPPVVEVPPVIEPSEPSLQPKVSKTVKGKA